MDDEYVPTIDRHMPGSFFGMTCMGNPHYFKNNARKYFKQEVYEFPAQKFLDAFTEIATLNKNPGCCRRVYLPKIFATAMGRELEDYELGYVIKYVNFGPAFRPGNIDYNEFKYGIDHMIKMGKTNCAKPKTLFLGDGKTPVPPALNDSYQELQEDYIKQKRKNVGPICEYRRAITGNHDIGWQHDLDPAKGARSRSTNWRGRNRTDVTRNEGICLQNAYGIIS